MAPRKFTPNANTVMQPVESRTHPQALTDKAKRNAHIGVLETFSELSQGHDGDELPRRHTNQLWSCPDFTDTLLFLRKESEMSKPKPVYSPQYRQQLVELVLAGRSANEVAKEFGLHTTTVAKWVRLDRMGIPSSAKHPSAKPSTGPLNANERQELIELRRKLRQVQMERDILAKATAWFAGKSEKTFTPPANS